MNRFIEGPEASINSIDKLLLTTIDLILYGIRVPGIRNRNTYWVENR